MGWRGYFYREVVPCAALIMVESINVGSSTIYKAAVTKGLSYYVFLAYSTAIPALVLLPLSFIFHRKTNLPPLTLGLLANFFVLALLGFTAQYLGYRGIAYSSPTLGSAMNNLTPALTFILAVLFRMEKLALRSLSSQAKIIGTVVSITGALVVVLYSGPVLIKMQATATEESLVVPISFSTTSTESNWIKGGCLLAVSYILISIWVIYQTKLVKDYPAELVIGFFYSLFGCIIATLVGLIMEPNFSRWKIKPNVELISVLYTGMIEKALGANVLLWGLRMKGPVYATLFKPLSIAIAVIMGVIFLGDNLYLGSVIGSMVISMGFYIVMWGRTKEEISENLLEYDVQSSSSNSNAPLLNYFRNVSDKKEDAWA